MQEDFDHRIRDWNMYVKASTELAFGASTIRKYVAMEKPFIFWQAHGIGTR